MNEDFSEPIGPIEWLTLDGARIPLERNLRVGPAKAMIDVPPQPKNGIEWLIDSAFLTLAETNPTQRDRLFRNWFDQKQPYACTEVWLILGMPKGNHPERGLTCES